MPRGWTAECRCDVQTRLQPVLMESVSEVRSGEPSVVEALDRCDSLLGCYRTQIELGVVVLERCDDCRRIRLCRWIQ